MKNSQKQWIYIIAIMLSVAGLALGFAAFTNTLTIKSSATVTPDASTFSVKFSSTYGELKDGELAPNMIAGPGGSDENVPTAENATISNVGNPTISGIKVNFTVPDQMVVYNYYVNNVGEYTAHIDLNASKLNPTITCTIPSDSDATPSLVEEACKGISVDVSYDSTNLGKGDQGYGSVTVSYNAGSAIADGNFDVNISDIKFVYSSYN